ncbi:iron-siderophore ABC transporter substrate-binding protein [Leptolyngbya sp. NK1-12]|nr:iron-siderophore ABC transporter substrate-binding protein [Leptolyngbya sp. NK1-12]
MHRSITRMLLVIITLIWVFACNSSTIERVAGSANNNVELQRSSTTHIVEHGMGKTEVPAQPSRIIALDEYTLECILALQSKPVGSVMFETMPSYLQDKTAGIENLGSEGEPSLEKILALQPDLILGTMYHQQTYSQLSQIAPTVLTLHKDIKDWKAALLNFAEALGKTAAAEQILQDYNNRLEIFKTQMGSRLKQTKVSVVRVYPTHISLYLKDVFIGTILDDAGLPRPPAQDKSGAAYEISRERIRDADGDVIFMWTYGYNQQRQQEAQAALEQLKADPLWSQLDAVQQGKVYQVPGYWIGAGPLAANAVIDDLFRYLVDQPVTSLQPFSAAHRPERLKQAGAYRQGVQAFAAPTPHTGGFEELRAGSPQNWGLGGTSFTLLE